MELIGTRPVDRSGPRACGGIVKREGGIVGDSDMDLLRPYILRYYYYYADYTLDDNNILYRCR